jgi:hypothetical protein
LKKEDWNGDYLMEYEEGEPTKMGTLHLFALSPTEERCTLVKFCSFL